MPQFKDKQDFCKQTNVKAERNEELIKFAKNNLNHIPFTDEAAFENYDRMISGMLYNPMQVDLEKSRMNLRDTLLDYGNFRCRDYKTTKEFANAKREYLKKFIGHVGEGTFMEYPMYFDYGFNTYLGENFYSNFNLTILDCSVVKIGNNVMCGTGVSLLTPSHPIDPTLRHSYLENALPITIGDNCWLGSNCTVLGGVTIGEGSVIAAGAVVNRDIPPNSLVVGVPGRVVKTMEPRDPDFDVHKTLKEYGMDYIP
ncbi:hypothetical protein PVL30_003543 [Lodderomyces elongisporus]|uniref:Maltose/galactoside acetyltransferase domain-containing protein n=1 Tax=Lodderomyces elongisporus (strain ATCC 11503 / CBS 2605 / JCM 1781 / NBRC 1676 / NRRL YB-4239) TaxID=379508 RepID=A5DZA9_LODEL|nr:uncharacterized protein PVL30_003543 [Lodderomyces elongisporus]EDK44517.1 hypothetical protein LELG_02696 [Lodderomyces elongisporus NRRL YB-4239]WLF79778.1 hypothetical protein PVL30_003543 [Lodderomyces elongisporus]